MVDPLAVAPLPADPTAVMFRRSLAWLLDLAIYVGVVVGAFAAMSEYVEIPEGLDFDTACEVIEASAGDAAAGCFVVGDRAYLLDGGEVGLQTVASLGWFVVFVVVQGLVGGSPGKLVLGLRVVTADGHRAGVARSLGRTLLWVVDGAPWIVPLVGPITGLTSAGHRRIGDLGAGTYVVSAGAVGSPVVAIQAAVPDDGRQWGAAPPVAPPPMADADRPAASTDVRDLPPPQWDAARRTYVQWEPNRGAWLQWDAEAERWEPLDS